MTDYSKELAEAVDAPPEDKKSLEKLVELQKDIAIAGSAEDFIRHPFFKLFENHINDIILDSKGKMSELLRKSETTMADLKAYQSGIDQMIELKKWWNAFVIKGRVARQAIEIYEQDTDDMNQQIQDAVEKSQLTS